MPTPSLLSGQLAIAVQAMSAGWYPTQAFDERGMPLWSVPGREGLSTLESFRDHAGLREAA